MKHPTFFGPAPFPISSFATRGFRRSARTGRARNAGIHVRIRHKISIKNLKKDPHHLTGFQSLLCRLFPFQLMKVIRARSDLISSLLNTKGIKMLLLVRDPRGTMQVRMGEIY